MLEAQANAALRKIKGRSKAAESETRQAIMRTGHGKVGIVGGAGHCPCMYTKRVTQPAE